LHFTLTDNKYAKNLARLSLYLLKQQGLSKNYNEKSVNPIIHTLDFWKLATELAKEFAEELANS
jgi:hypothetical protein